MEYILVLLPSVCVAIVFYIVMKAILNADRKEREAEAEIKAELAENESTDSTVNSASEK